jgi:hypothetical protein
MPLQSTACLSRTSATGAIIGAIISIVWLEVLLTAGVMIIGVAVAWLVSKPRFHVEKLQGILAAVSVMFAAHSAPVKFVDRRVHVDLTSIELPLSGLAMDLAADPQILVIGAFPETIIRLPSRRPTYRQVDAALRRYAGYTLRAGYCGSGATLLFGAHPIGPLELEPIRP